MEVFIATLLEANQISPGLPLMIIMHIYIMSEAQIELKRTLHRNIRFLVRVPDYFQLRGH